MSQIASFMLIAIITVELFYGWLLGTSYIYQVPYLLRLNTPIVFLIGPGVYFLVKATIQPSAKWEGKFSLHFIPFFLVILYFIPVYLSPIAEKVKYLDEMHEQLPFDSLLIGGLRRIHQLIYLVISVIWLRSKQEKIINKKPAYAVLSAFAFLLAFDIYRYFFVFDLLTGIIDTFLLSAIAVYLVYDQLSSPPSVKYASGPNPEDLEQCATIVKQTLADKKPYLNPRFSLDELAEICNLKKHLVSQTINQEMGTNFNTLVNQYRVEEAIKLLGSHDTRHLTIQAIAEKAGFNSISSFNENFKKQTSRSPRDYRIKSSTEL